MHICRLYLFKGNMVAVTFMLARPKTFLTLAYLAPVKIIKYPGREFVNK